MTTTNPGIQAAGAWKPDNFCSGTGYTREPLTGEGQGGADLDAKYICSMCKGTGRIYALPDSVRVSCVAIACINGHIAGGWPHSVCHGLGYTPSDRLEVWLEAARKMMVERRWVLSPEIHAWYILEVNSYRTPEEGIKYKDFEEIARGNTPLYALQQALVLVLEADGFTMGGTP